MPILLWPRGGSAFTQTLTAELDSAGSLVKSTEKGLTASVSPAASFVRGIFKNLAATVSTTAGLSRTIAALLVAELQSSATLQRATSLVQSAVIAPAGNLIAQGRRMVVLTAQIAASSSLGKTIGKRLGAVVAPAATLGKLIARGLRAAISFIGKLVIGGNSPPAVLNLSAPLLDQLSFEGTLGTALALASALEAQVDLTAPLMA